LIRQQADYEDLISMDENTIELLLPKIRSLIYEIDGIIQNE